jgi:hypothetical protein
MQPLRTRRYDAMLSSRLVKGQRDHVTLRYSFFLNLFPENGSTAGRGQNLLNTNNKRAGYRVQRSDVAAGSGWRAGYGYHIGPIPYDTPHLSKYYDLCEVGCNIPQQGSGNIARWVKTPERVTNPRAGRATAESGKDER